MFDRKGQRHRTQRELPTMSDDGHVALRAAYIKQGLINPNPELKFMSAKEVETYRQQLIKQGNLSPNQNPYRRRY